MLRTLGALGSSLLGWGNSRPAVASGRGRTRKRRVWLVWSIVIAVLVLLVSVGASNHQRHQLTFDIFDEGAHYDYVVALTHGHVPRAGETLSQETMRAISCFGGYALPPMGCQVKHRDADTLPAAGYSYEAVQQPPLGYLPFVLTSRPDAAPATALVDARWGGLIWNAIGGALLVLVGWLAELSLFELGTLLVICLLGPVQIHAMSTVSNDSSGIAAGALVLVTYLISRRRDKSMIIAGLVTGVVVGFMKGLFVAAPLAIFLGVVLADIAARRRPRRDELLARYGCSAAMTVGAAAAYAAWILIVDARAIVSVSVVLHAVEGFSITPYPRPRSMLTGFMDQMSTLVAYAPAPLYWIWNLIVFGSLAGILVLRGPVARPAVRAMALAVFIAMAALAVAFVLLNFVEGHYDIPAPARYGLSLLPIAAFALVRALRVRGLLLIGLLLPAAAVVAQLVGGQF